MKSPEISLQANGLLRDLRGLGLNDFAALDAAGADTQLLRHAIHFGFHGAKVNVPAPTCNVVRVRDVVSELRTLAADLTNLSHDKTPNLNCSRAQARLISPLQNEAVTGEKRG